MRSQEQGQGSAKTIRETNPDDFLFSLRCSHPTRNFTYSTSMSGKKKVNEIEHMTYKHQEQEYHINIIKTSDRLCDL